MLVARTLPAIYAYRCQDCGIAATKVIPAGRSGSGPKPKHCQDCAEQRRAEQIRAQKRTARAKYGTSFRARARFYGVEYEPINRLRVYERDRWKCGLCRKKVKRDALAPDPMAPSLDHVVPMSQGGGHLYANVQLAHFWCNSMKGSGGGQQLALIG